LDAAKPFYTFFFKIQSEVKLIWDNPDKAKENLIARDPVFYQKTLFRAFLHLDKEETENMTYQQYMDYQIMLKECLKLLHAPYLNSGE